MTHAIETNMTKRHVHSWEFICWSGKNLANVSFRCKKCLAVFEREMSKEERSFYTSNYDDFSKPDSMNNIWFDFNKRFRPVPKNSYAIHGKWKFIGYDLMKRVRKWAKKYPEHVNVLLCSDSYFSTSDLVLIQIRTEDKYGALHVIFIPQCSGESPIEFVLTEFSCDRLIKTLTALSKTAKQTIARQNQIENKKAKGWKDLLKFPSKNLGA